MQMQVQQYVPDPVGLLDVMGLPLHVLSTNMQCLQTAVMVFTVPNVDLPGQAAGHTPDTRSLMQFGLWQHTVQHPGCRSGRQG